MKLKAVVYSNCSVRLLEALQSREFRTRVLKDVLVPHLHVPDDFGPAEFYVQHCDLTHSGPMCEARLTGVSVTENRSTTDFENARTALEDVYKDCIEKFLLPHGEECQLLVSIMLDQIPFNRKSSLIEAPAITVTSYAVD